MLKRASVSSFICTRYHWISSRSATSVVQPVAPYAELALMDAIRDSAIGHLIANDVIVCNSRTLDTEEENSCDIAESLRSWFLQTNVSMDALMCYVPSSELTEISTNVVEVTIIGRTAGR
ncbi:hypothetical protein EG68_11652 [Paragonimus skrjabini miyazakii]|uniref:Uncharacterized protein n=1 Tax=Paragonimus skrjabini miyazakii TaxID=59628 RepID=A0A8S9YHE8_9TREM|nr:hypothetical protein EG68_11652 [Paragonimus skrjabini miyazakii]